MAVLYFYRSMIRKRGLFHSFALYVESCLKKRIILPNNYATSYHLEIFFLGRCNKHDGTLLPSNMLDLTRVTLAYLDTQPTRKLQN